MQTGALLPTPDNSGGATFVWSYVVQVDRAFVTSKRGIVLTGSVLSNTGGSPFGDLTGNEVVISGSFMLPVDPVPVANTAYTAVSVNVVGVANLFGKQGYGNISLLASGTNPQAPVANAGKRVVTAKNVVQLSAAGSSDPMGGALTYSWKFIPIYGQTANITGADTANPVVTLPDYSDAVGDYTFQLTVTNQAGLSSTDTVIVTYDPSTGTSGQ